MAPVHTDEVDRAFDAECSKVLASLAEKGGERRFVHFARSHRERAMADLAKTAGVTVDRHVVRRIGKRYCRALLAHQCGEGLGIERVAAQNPMSPKQPQIAKFADRRPSQTLG